MQYCVCYFGAFGDDYGIICVEQMFEVELLECFLVPWVVNLFANIVKHNEHGEYEQVRAEWTTLSNSGSLLKPATFIFPLCESKLWLIVQ